MFYKISFDEVITTQTIYSKILPQLHKYFRSDSRRELDILIDFTNVEYINPNVIPNILAIGLILKNFYLHPVRLFIPWKPKLLSYLFDINFLTIVRKYNIFKIYEENVGDFPINCMNSEYRTYYFENGTNKEDIRYDLQKSISVIRNLYEGKSSDEYDDELKKIIYIFTEVCHNSSNHSEGMCFATFQSNINENVKYKKAYISISDCGIGYYNSLLKKIENNDFIPIMCNKHEFLELKANKNFIAIIEAMYFRRSSTNYGLFHVISAVMAANGVVRIHSEDTQIIITNKFYEEYLKDLNFEDKQKINILLECFKIGENNNFSNVRNYDNKYKGVHLELEIPIHR